MVALLNKKIDHCRNLTSAGRFTCRGGAHQIGASSPVPGADCPRRRQTATGSKLEWHAEHADPARLHRPAGRHEQNPSILVWFLHETRLDRHRCRIDEVTMTKIFFRLLLTLALSGLAIPGLAGTNIDDQTVSPRVTPPCPGLMTQ
jgi:hypothetical protein